MLHEENEGKKAENAIKNKLMNRMLHSEQQFVCLLCISAFQ